MKLTRPRPTLVAAIAFLFLLQSAAADTAPLCSALGFTVEAIADVCTLGTCSIGQMVFGNGIASQQAALAPLSASATASITNHTALNDSNNQPVPAPIIASASGNASFSNASQGTINLGFNVSTGPCSTATEADANVEDGYMVSVPSQVSPFRFDGFLYTFGADASGNIVLNWSTTTSDACSPGPYPSSSYFDVVQVLGAGSSSPQDLPPNSSGTIAVPIAQGNIYTLWIETGIGFGGGGGDSVSHSSNFTFSIPSGSSVSSPAATCSYGTTGNLVGTEGIKGIAPSGSGSSITGNIQPSEWISVYGLNLVSSPVNWNGDFVTSLGGVTVTVDGIPGYLSYVGPSQINLQAPNDSTTGPVPVIVTTPSGTFTTTVTLAPSAPSFFLLDNTHVAGIILRTDGSGAYGGGTYDILGPTGDSLGYATVAAKPGDNVELFGTGFGPTSPTVLAGQPFSGSAPTISPVGLVINGVGLTPSFAGLSSAGLDQINLTIPSGLGSGDVPLVGVVAGTQTAAGIVISLQ